MSDLDQNHRRTSSPSVCEGEACLFPRTQRLAQSSLFARAGCRNRVLNWEPFRSGLCVERSEGGCGPALSGHRPLLEGGRSCASRREETAPGCGAALGRAHPPGKRRRVTGVTTLGPIFPPPPPRPPRESAGGRLLSSSAEHSLTWTPWLGTSVRVTAGCSAVLGRAALGSLVPRTAGTCVAEECEG